MEILLAAKLPIYQKSSMAHRVTWYLTAVSTEMLNGLENLQQVSELYRYDAFNLLSCLTIDVENIHLVVHRKDLLFKVIDYPRNFTNPVKEGLKRATHWVAYYFTNLNSWYAIPERAIILLGIQGKLD